MKIKFNWMVCFTYIVFNAVLLLIGISLISNPLSWVMLNAVFIWNDVRSYEQGLEDGGNIVRAMRGEA